MAIIKEFQEFIAKGNVMDLAVGVIIGASFGKIVDSIVNDLVMPVVGLVLGGIDFSNLFIPLSMTDSPATLAEAKAKAIPVLAYGNFITVVIQFLILAWIVFLMVKGVNTIRKKLEKQPEAAAEAPPPADVALLTEIRDLLARGAAK